MFVTESSAGEIRLPPKARGAVAVSRALIGLSQMSLWHRDWSISGSLLILELNVRLSICLHAGRLGVSFNCVHGEESRTDEVNWQVSAWRMPACNKSISVSTSSTFQISHLTQLSASFPQYGPLSNFPPPPFDSQENLLPNGFTPSSGQGLPSFPLHWTRIRQSPYVFVQIVLWRSMFPENLNFHT